MLTQKMSFFTPEEVPLRIQAEFTCKSLETKQKAVVILLHPHPLMGGNMHFKLLPRLARILYQNAFDVLRFNFRGVGESEGLHGGGILEGYDLLGAYAFLAEKGYDKIFIAGYSFGSVVGLSQIHNLKLNAFAAIGFPNSEQSLTKIVKTEDPIKIPTLFASGENDEYSNLAEIKNEIKFDIEPEILEIPDENHFFEKSWLTLCESVSIFIQKHL